MIAARRLQLFRETKKGAPDTGPPFFDFFGPVAYSASGAAAEALSGRPPSCHCQVVPGAGCQIAAPPPAPPLEPPPPLAVELPVAAPLPVASPPLAPDPAAPTPAPPSPPADSFEQPASTTTSAST